MNRLAECCYCSSALVIDGESVPRAGQHEHPATRQQLKYMCQERYLFPVMSVSVACNQ